MAEGGGILDTLGGPPGIPFIPGIPSITGGDAGPADAYLGTGDIDLSARFSSPFIFGGSGKGVNTALTGFTTVAVIGVIGLLIFLLVRRFG